MFQLSVMPRSLRQFSCFSLLAFLYLVVFTFIVLFTRNVYSAEVTLAWDASADPSCAGYKIYKRTSAETYGDGLKVENRTEHEFLQLDDGQTYLFAVTAYDEYENESTFSNEVTWKSEATWPSANDDYTRIPQSEFNVVLVDSEETKGEDGRVDNAIDGRPDTFWHTEWHYRDPVHPHEMVIDLGDTYIVAGFQYLPRQDGCINGTVADYSLYVSEDGLAWEEAVATGTFAGDTTEKEVMFDPKPAQYVRFVALSEVNGRPWTSAAEINILGRP
jgi:fibronectin type 3 domain-containing protein